SESSIGSGVRRLEALTGTEALNYLGMLQTTASQLADDLRVPTHGILDAVASLEGTVRRQDRKIERLRVELASRDVDGLLDEGHQVDGTSVLSTRVDAPKRDTLLSVGDRLKDRMQSGVIVLGGVIDERPVLIAMVTPDQIERGLRAGDIIK